MGHIANKIDAKDKNLSEVLNGQRYKIDSFQREYRWQRKHIEALISDLSISFLKNYKNGHTIGDYDEYDCYYMGPIVLSEEKKGLSIVDGQQRLTSFTLLIIYLLHAQSKFDLDIDRVKDLRQFLFVTKGGRKTLILNVESRNTIMDHLISDPDTVFGGSDEDLAKEDASDDSKILDESIQNIIERYEDIIKLFPSDLNNKIVLPIFIEWLLEKVILVEVKAYSMENAYTIFETMNDRGLSLNPTEILKGFLLSKIDDETKNDEINLLWKSRILEIKSQTGVDGDLEFFRAWLRGKYAETIRMSKIGAENEDFEIIGTQFHTWIKNNPAKVLLRESDDYYFFIRSDFYFFSDWYNKIYSANNELLDNLEYLYISNFYTIAESLSYPLYLASLSKIDDEETLVNKIRLVNRFIDIYTNIRTLQNKPITQSSIRYSMYELVRAIRDLKPLELKKRLFSELEKNSNQPYGYISILQEMDNWGYFHYFFARIIHFVQGVPRDFSELLRTKKQSSLVLFRLFEDHERPNEVSETAWERHISSIAGYCLVKRKDIEFLRELKPFERLQHLLEHNYLPEMEFQTYHKTVVEFIAERDHVIQSLINVVWSFDVKLY